MAGVPDLKKRAAVRAVLLLPKFQALGDRAVAVTLGVSKHLVTSVRRRMIFEGVHPPRTHYLSAAGNEVEWAGYQPGSPARGGYVYDGRGNVVREDEWKAARAAEAARPGPEPPGGEPRRRKRA